MKRLHSLYGNRNVLAFLYAIALSTACGTIIKALGKSHGISAAISVSIVFVVVVTVLHIFTEPGPSPQKETIFRERQSRKNQQSRKDTWRPKRS